MTVWQFEMFGHKTGKIEMTVWQFEMFGHKTGKIVGTEKIGVHYKMWPVNWVVIKLCFETFTSGLAGIKLCKDHI